MIGDVTQIRRGHVPETSHKQFRRANLVRSEVIHRRMTYEDDHEWRLLKNLKRGDQVQFEASIRTSKSFGERDKTTTFPNIQ
jgi:hypothetical protein